MIRFCDERDADLAHPHPLVVPELRELYLLVAAAAAVYPSTAAAVVFWLEEVKFRAARITLRDIVVGHPCRRGELFRSGREPAQRREAPTPRGADGFEPATGRRALVRALRVIGLILDLKKVPALAREHHAKAREPEGVEFKGLAPGRLERNGYQWHVVLGIGKEVEEILLQHRPELP